MRRRHFLLGSGSAVLLARPASTFAQDRKLPTIGYLGIDRPEASVSRLAAFKAGLLHAGYVEGRNVRIEFRWASGRHEMLPKLAGELVESEVDLIVAPGGAPVALAARAATSRIPIVFEMGGDPIRLGLVETLNRPGGNLTGTTSLSVETTAKRLAILHELLPTGAAVAMLRNPTSPTADAQWRSLQSAAKELGRRMHLLEGSTEPELTAALEAVRSLPADGLVFHSDPFFAYRAEFLAREASRLRVAAIHQSRDFPMAGGLLSYGGDFIQSHRNAGVYAGRILAGEKASDLPVEQVTRLEMVVNVKAAAALGIAIPATVVAQADMVID
jgi:putative tryptophan/tyrosine transport system substrate-binding protein